jgi:hypothetical protein
VMSRLEGKSFQFGEGGGDLGMFRGSGWGLGGCREAGMATE